MITLRTLPYRSQQAVYQQGVTHMLRQGRACLNDQGDGAYKHNGLSCPAGCFISDWEYDPGIEGLSWGMLIFKDKVPNEHRNIIQAMQNIHDGFHDSPEEWQMRLENLSNQFKVNTDFMRELK